MRLWNDSFDVHFLCVCRLRRWRHFKILVDSGGSTSLCQWQKNPFFLVTVLVSVCAGPLTEKTSSARSTFVQSVSPVLICCIFECLRLVAVCRYQLHFLEQNLNSLSLLIANWLPEYSGSFFLFSSMTASSITATTKTTASPSSSSSLSKWGKSVFYQRDNG